MISYAVSPSLHLLNCLCLSSNLLKCRVVDELVRFGLLSALANLDMG
jgi:hypothetical protein